MSVSEMDEMFNRILWNNDKLLLLRANNPLTFKEHRCYNKANPYIYELFSFSATETATYKTVTQTYYFGNERFATLDEMLDCALNKSKTLNLEKEYLLNKPHRDRSNRAFYLWYVVFFVPSAVVVSMPFALLNVVNEYVFQPEVAKQIQLFCSPVIFAIVVPPLLLTLIPVAIVIDVVYRIIEP